MPPKRRTRYLPVSDDQMFFSDPVYQNDLLAEGIPRPSMSAGRMTESNETIVNSDHEQSSELFSTAKLVVRIQQIQKSIQQARTMLDSMEKFENIVPGCDEQREKLRSIVANLEQQQASYVNLLNLVTLSSEEYSAMYEEHQKDDVEDDLSLRGNIQSPVRPRIESKIGFVPQTSNVAMPTLNFSDHEQTSRNDYSNYDSLVGSLKSDTLIYHDQQATSDEEATDVESEKEMERALTLQKEQIRALQGQQRALLALKRRSEQRLVEQQQLALDRTSTTDENDLLSDIQNLRNRLQPLRDRYEQRQLKNLTAENRLKNLQHVRERLDELEQIVTYYQHDDSWSRPAAEPDQTTNSDALRQWERLSGELNAKRAELERAKSALNQLQHMVKNIQPDELSSTSSRSTPVSQSSDIKRSSDQCQLETPLPRLAAQQREFERLVESRQHLHTLKDRTTTLHESESTSPVLLNDAANIRPSYHYQEPETLAASSGDLSVQMHEICQCLSTFIDEQKSFNHHIEQRLSTATNSSAPDPIFNQLQQQVLAQGLIVNLNSAYREIAVLQSEINALQSENNRLTSSLSNQTIRPLPRSSTNGSRATTSRLPENPGPSKKPLVERTPPKLERQGTFSTEDSSSWQRSKPSVDAHGSAQSFVIHRRPMPTEQQLSDYKEKLDEQSVLSSVDDYQPLQELAVDDDTTDDELQSRDFPTSANQNLSRDDVQTIDLQVKSIMVQLIPFMRLRINDVFNPSILTHIRERILFLFKQQPDSSQLIRQFASQFSELIDTTIEKYSGSTVRECAADLIRDVSDVAFDEMIRYKIIHNGSSLIQNITSEAIDTHLYDPYQRYRTHGALFSDDGIGNDDSSDSEENELQSTVRLVRVNPSSANGHDHRLVINPNSSN